MKTKAPKGTKKKQSSKTQKLTIKQALFCREYLVDLNATKAAQRAGYSKKTACKIGSENLQKPDIQIRLTELIAKRLEKTEASADWVVQKLIEIVERSTQAVPVLNKKGTQTGKYKYDSTGANKALELIGRHNGMWKDNLNLNHGGHIDSAITEIPFKDMSSEQLAAIAHRSDKDDTGTA